jgi:hypothetical protein
MYCGRRHGLREISGAPGKAGVFQPVEVRFG